MEVKEFQKKLGELLKIAGEQERKMTADQIREFFRESPLEDARLSMICGYLSSQGVTVEGYTGVNQETVCEEEEPEQTVPLTEEEEAYLKAYQESLPGERSSEEKAALLKALGEGKEWAVAELAQAYLPEIIDVCKRRHAAEVFVGDMLQEVSVSFLDALTSSLGTARDDAWICREIEKGAEAALEAENQQKFQDDYLVTKVRNLEAAVKELTEDGESKFSIQELSILLDMDEEEIRDVLRLTGDDK